MASVRPDEVSAILREQLAGSKTEAELEEAGDEGPYDHAAGLVERWAALAIPPAPGQAAQFQDRVKPWLMACFGEVIAGNREERNHRFLEESLELVQACGCSASEAHQLVDYVFDRPIGEPTQEVGGVTVTLASLCLANGLDMHDAAEIELARIWTKMETIRAKQAAKPKHSPLPLAATPTAPAASGGEVERLREALRPFADRANRFDGVPPPKYFGNTDCVLRYYDDQIETFTLGDCRRARAALTPTAAPGSGA